MHIMFCVSGFSGVGKDEFCKRLVENHQAIHTGLADPAKRHMADIYGFTRDQLFGPSYMRNAGDRRYPKTHVTSAGGRPAGRDELLLDSSRDSYTHPEKQWWCVDLDPSNPNYELFINAARMTIVWGGEESCAMIGDRLIPSRRLKGTRLRVFFEDVDPLFFLSPREALQRYCDLMNQMYLCTWVRSGVEVHRKLAGSNGTSAFLYDRMTGLTPSLNLHVGRDVITCFSDFRHWHEIEYVRQASKEFGDFTPIFVRVKRPGIELPPYNHRSEVEQASIQDSEFNFVVSNDGSVSDLHRTVDDIVKMVKAGTA